MEDLTVVATGDKWVGKGVRSFDQVVEELLEDAKVEVMVTAYVVTDPNLYAKLESALVRGVKVHIYSDNIEDERSGDLLRRLDSLKTRHPHLETHIIDEEVLHAKVIVTDSVNVLVGSANLTRSGLVNNYELGVLIHDRKTADRVTNLLRALE